MHWATQTTNVFLFYSIYKLFRSRNKMWVDAAISINAAKVTSQTLKSMRVCVCGSFITCNKSGVNKCMWHREQSINSIWAIINVCVASKENRKIIIEFPNKKKVSQRSSRWAIMKETKWIDSACYFLFQLTCREAEQNAFERCVFFPPDRLDFSSECIFYPFTKSTAFSMYNMEMIRQLFYYLRFTEVYMK